MAARREAQARYLPALLRAYDELTREGDPYPYAMLARTAGVSRQAVHQQAERALAARRASRPSAHFELGYDLAAEAEPEAQS